MYITQNPSPEDWPKEVRSQRATFLALNHMWQKPGTGILRWRSRGEVETSFDRGLSVGCRDIKHAINSEQVKLFPVRLGPELFSISVLATWSVCTGHIEVQKRRHFAPGVFLLLIYGQQGTIREFTAKHRAQWRRMEELVRKWPQFNLIDGLKGAVWWIPSGFISV